jgi:uncharacterized peroxidase-related enzyme
VAFIKVIQPELADGELKKIYDDLLSSRGKVAEVHKIQSLNPKSIIDHMELYMTIMYDKSPLKRVYRELMAVVVSAANECEYCVEHHAAAVGHYWKDEERLAQLKTDYEQVDLDPLELAVCDFADLVTRKPIAAYDGSAAQKLKEAGLDDRAILDAALVVGYFNFVNRIVLSLGVYLEEDGGEGYKYE